jgi:hypothetical protein
MQEEGAEEDPEGAAAAAAASSARALPVAVAGIWGWPWPEIAGDAPLREVAAAPLGGEGERRG